MRDIEPDAFLSILLRDVGSLKNTDLVKLRARMRSSCELVPPPAAAKRATLRASLQHELKRMFAPSTALKAPSGTAQSGSALTALEAEPKAEAKAEPNAEAIEGAAITSPEAIASPEPNTSDEATATAAVPPMGSLDATADAESAPSVPPPKRQSRAPLGRISASANNLFARRPSFERRTSKAKAADTVVVAADATCAVASAAPPKRLSLTARLPSFERRKSKAKAASAPSQIVAAPPNSSVLSSTRHALPVVPDADEECDANEALGLAASLVASAIEAAIDADNGRKADEAHAVAAAAGFVFSPCRSPTKRRCPPIEAASNLSSPQLISASRRVLGLGAKPAASAPDSEVRRRDAHRRALSLLAPVLLQMRAVQDFLRGVASYTATRCLTSVRRVFELQLIAPPSAACECP